MQMSAGNHLDTVELRVTTLHIVPKSKIKSNKHRRNL